MARVNTKCRTHCSTQCWWGGVRLQERITGNTENAAQRIRFMALSSTCHRSERQKWREGKIFEKDLEMVRTALEGSYQYPQKFKTVTQPWSGTHKLKVLLFPSETKRWMQWRQGVSCTLLCPQYLKQRCYRRHLVSTCWICDLREAERTTPHTWLSKSHGGKSSLRHWPPLFYFSALCLLWSTVAVFSLPIPESPLLLYLLVAGDRKECLLKLILNDPDAGNASDPIPHATKHECQSLLSSPFVPSNSTGECLPFFFLMYLGVRSCFLPSQSLPSSSFIISALVLNLPAYSVHLISVEEFIVWHFCLEIRQNLKSQFLWVKSLDTA